MVRAVTATDAVKALALMQLPEVKPGTIRQWAKRGQVRTYGLASNGAQRYELADIVERVKSDWSRSVG